MKKLLSIKPNVYSLLYVMQLVHLIQLYSDPTLSVYVRWH